MSRANGVEKYLDHITKAKYEEGVLDGVKLMENRMLIACENGAPINIEGRAFFIRSDIQNLRDIFDDLEGDNKS